MKFNILNSIFLIALASFVKANTIEMEDETTEENAGQISMPITTSKQIISTTTPTPTTTISTTITPSFYTTSITYQNFFKSGLRTKEIRVPSDVEEAVIRCVEGEEIPEGKKSICTFDHICYNYYDEFQDSEITYNSKTYRQRCGIYTRKANDPVPTDYFEPDNICRLTKTLFTYTYPLTSYVNSMETTAPFQIISYVTYRIVPKTTSITTTLCKESISLLYATTTTTTTSSPTTTISPTISPIPTTNTSVKTLPTKKITTTTTITTTNISSIKEDEIKNSSKNKYSTKKSKKTKKITSLTNKNKKNPMKFKTKYFNKKIANKDIYKKIEQLMKKN